jgi:hypothetical protein
MKVSEVEKNNTHIYWDAYPKYDDYDKLSCHVFHLAECLENELGGCSKKEIQSVKEFLYDLVEKYGS